MKEMNGISKLVKAEIDEVACYSKIDKVDKRYLIFFSVRISFFDFNHLICVNRSYHSVSYMPDFVFAVNANHPF